MKLTLFLLPALLLFALGATTEAQNIIWYGTIDTDWNTAGNWNPAIVPGPGTAAFIYDRVNDPVVTGGFACGDLTVYGSATLVVASGDFHVTGDLIVNGNLIMQPGAGELRLSGDVTVSQDGPGITNLGTTMMDGSGTTWVPTLTLPPVEVDGGLRTFSNTNVQSLLMSGGEIEFDGIVAVAGDVDLVGGQLSWTGTSGYLKGFDVEGDFNEANVTIGATYSQTRIYCAGDWASTSSFVLPLGIVELDGGTAASIGGPGPTFQNVEFLDAGSVKTLVDDITVLGTLKVDLGATLDLAAQTVNSSGSWESYDGASSVLGSPGLIAFSGVGTLRTGSKLLPPIRVDGGVLAIDASVLSSIEMTAGAIDIQSGKTINVAGDVDLHGGTLGWLDSDGYLETLDIEGNFTVTGAVVGATSAEARIYCAGDWSSPATFVMPAGIVELDGGTAASIGGAGPTFTNLEIRDAGSVKTLTADAAVLASMKVRSNTTLDLATHTFTASGSWESHEGGASVLGAPGLVAFDGVGTLRTGSNLLPPVRVDGGVLAIDASLLSSIEMNAGAIDIQSGKTINVAGDVDLHGGTLGWLDSDGYLETLDIEGDLTVTGAVVGATSAEARIYCAGDWSSPATFVMPAGIVELDGGTAASIGGAGPTFTNLEIRDAGSVKTLTADAAVLASMKVRSNTTLDLATHTFTASGSWESHEGGSSVLGAPGLVAFDGVGTLRTGSKLLPPIRVDGGALSIDASLLSAIELTAGAIDIQSGKTINVTGDVDLSGGTLSWLDTDGYFETLDIEGDFTTSGATLGTFNTETRLHVAGDWTSDSGFSLTQGLVKLDGSGTTLVSGITPGDVITLPTLELSNGPRTIGNDLTLAPTSLEIKSGASLDLGGNRMTLPGAPVTVKGDLTVGPGGELQLGSTVDMTVTSSGSLSVVGDPGNPAAVTGHLGGGYALEIDGTLAARNFVLQEMGPAGIDVDGAIAAAPDDLRGGVFDLAASGGVLLDLGQSASQTLWYTTFLNSTGTAAANVRRVSGSPVNFQNFGGAFGGEAFEDDPSGLIEWLPPATTELAYFTADNGPEQVYVAWQTTSEVDVEAFVLQAGASLTGPFAAVVELAPTGPGVYAFTHEPLVEDVQVFYQLHERISTGALNLLAQASAEPYDADLPAAFKTVGPAGEYATIQEAVNAAGAPFSVVVVEAGTYDAFSIDTPPGNIHVIPDGSGTVVIDTTGGALEIRNTLAGQTVQLVDLVVNGNDSGASLLIQDTAGTVILDQLEVHGGVGQPGISALGAVVIALQRSTVDGAPGFDVNASTVYASRGALDAADLTVGSTLKTTQLAPVVTLDPSSVHVPFTGVMPDISAPNLATLGQTTTIDIETEPGGVWVLTLSPGYGYLDLDQPAFWQMAAFVNLFTYFELGGGVSDATTGQDSFAVPIPADGDLLGREFIFQLLHVAGGAPLLRPSNVLTVLALPDQP